MSNNDYTIDDELETRIRELKEINSHVVMALRDFLKYKTNDLYYKYEFYVQLWNKKYQELKEYTSKVHE